MQSRPPFMNGLLTARSILLSLKERKLTEQRQRGRRKLDQNNQYHEPSPPIIQPNPSPPPLQAPPQQLPPSRRCELSTLLNQIGLQLHELHLQNQTYETIFHRLAEHYLLNHRIVEDNERYKRRSYQLEEQIKEFKEKIRKNYEELETVERQGVEMQVFMQQALQEFLTAEKERGLVQPIRNSSVKVKEILEECVKIGDGKDWENSEEGEGPKESLSLNWRSLAQKTAKKPQVRKAKQAQDMRDSLFHSELYNI